MITKRIDKYIIFIPETNSEETQLVECVNEGLYDYDGAVYYKEVEDDK